MTEEHSRVPGKYIPDFTEAMHNFADYELLILGKSAGWTRQLQIHLRCYKKYLAYSALDYTAVTRAQAADFKKYLTQIKTKKNTIYSTSYINTTLITVKLFYTYALQQNILFQNPFNYISLLREEEKVKTELPKEKELSHILDMLSRFNDEKHLERKITRFKIYVLAELMYATGIRISDAALIEEKDINFEKGIITIIDFKTKKQRFVFVCEYALRLLQKYLAVKDILLYRGSKKNAHSIFKAGTNQLGVTLNAYLKTISTKRMTSHSLRHCFGYHFLKRGCDIFYIKNFLGHASLDNTQIYTRIDKQNLKSMLDIYHPRQMRKKP